MFVFLLAYFLGIMSSRPIHVVSYDRLPFVFKSVQYHIVHIDHVFSLSIHLSVDSGVHSPLAIVNNAAVNMGFL
jgi:hypothetical protein